MTFRQKTMIFMLIIIFSRLRGWKQRQFAFSDMPEWLPVERGEGHLLGWEHLLQQKKMENC